MTYPQTENKDCQILVAEDNRVSKNLAVTMLKKSGFHKVTAVSNGEEIFDHIAGTSFDIVLMDCQMPLLDGYESTRIIKKNFDRNGIIVIAVTSDNSPESLKRCKAVGMDGIIEKPFTVAKLERALEERWDMVV